MSSNIIDETVNEPNFPNLKAGIDTNLIHENQMTYVQPLGGQEFLDREVNPSFLRKLVSGERASIGRVLISGGIIGGVVGGSIIGLIGTGLYYGLKKHNN